MLLSVVSAVPVHCHKFRAFKSQWTSTSLFTAPSYYVQRQRNLDILIIKFPVGSVLQSLPEACSQATSAPSNLRSNYKRHCGETKLPVASQTSLRSAFASKFVLEQQVCHECEPEGATCQDIS